MNLNYSEVRSAHLYTALHPQASMASSTLQSNDAKSLHAACITRKTSARCDVQVVGSSSGDIEAQGFFKNSNSSSAKTCPAQLDNTVMPSSSVKFLVSLQSPWGTATGLLSRRSTQLSVYGLSLLEKYSQMVLLKTKNTNARFTAACSISTLHRAVGRCLAL